MIRRLRQEIEHRRVTFLTKKVGGVMNAIRLTHYELYKILSSRILIVFLPVLIAANVILCAVNAEDYQKNNSYDAKTQEYVDKVYDLYLQSPDFALSEYERLSKISGPRLYTEYKYCDKGYSDRDIFEKAYEIFGADALYHKKLTKLIAQTQMANSNIAFNEGGKDSYLYRSNEAMLNVYTELNEKVTLTDRKVIGWNEYFSYSSEAFFVIGAVTLAAVYLAVADRKTGMSMIIGASKNGRAPTASAKYLSVAIITVLLVVLFALSSFLTVLCTVGYSDGTVAVQSVKALQLTAVRTSAIGMLFLSLLYKILAALGFALLLVAVVSFVKSYIFGVAVGFGFAGLCYVMTTLEPARFGQGIFLNFISFYDPAGALEHYRSVNIFEQAIDLRVAGAALLGVLFAVSFALTLAAQSFRKPRTIAGLKFDLSRLKLFRNKQKRSYRPRRRSLSLFYYELFKQRYVFILLALLIVLKIIVSSSYYQPVKNIYDIYKREYLSEIAGTYTEEKRMYLEAEKQRLAEYDARENEMQDAYSSGKIGIEEYSAFLGEQISAMYRAEVVEGLLDRADYLEKQHERTGVWGSFVYETGYNRYQNQPVDYLLLVFLLIFACRFYLIEQEKRGAASPMIMTVQTYARGRLPLFARKLAVNLLFTAGAIVVFKGIDLYFLCKNFALPDMSSPLISLPRYSSAPAPFSLFGYMAFTIAFSFVGTLLLSLVFFLSSIYIKRTLLTLLAAASVLFIPHFIYLFGQKAGNYIDLTQLQQTDRLFRFAQSSGGAMYYLFFAAALAFVMALTVVSVFKIEKGKRMIT